MEKWDDNLEPVAIKIEVYGLGRYMGIHSKNNDVSMNLDILEALSKKYNIKLTELTRAYAQGVIDSYKY